MNLTVDVSIQYGLPTLTLQAATLPLKETSSLDKTTTPEAENLCRTRNQKQSKKFSTHLRKTLALYLASVQFSNNKARYPSRAHSRCSGIHRSSNLPTQQLKTENRQANCTARGAAAWLYWNGVADGVVAPF